MFRRHFGVTPEDLGQMLSFPGDVCVRLLPVFIGTIVWWVLETPLAKSYVCRVDRDEKYSSF